MARYTVKLTKTEAGELDDIVSKGSHTSQTFRAAYILLNYEKGDYSDKVSNEQVSKALKIERVITVKHMLHPHFKKHLSGRSQPPFGIGLNLYTHPNMEAG